MIVEVVNAIVNANSGKIVFLTANEVNSGKNVTLGFNLFENPGRVPPMPLMPCYVFFMLTCSIELGSHLGPNQVENASRLDPI